MIVLFPNAFSRSFRRFLAGAICGFAVLLTSMGHCQLLVMSERVYTGTTGLHQGAKFGWSMATGGGYVAVGSPHFDGQDGRITMYRATDFVTGDEVDAIQYPFTVPPAVIQQRFSASIALGDSMMVVGNCSAYGTNQYCGSSAAWVSVFRPNGANWQGTQVLERPPGAIDAFGKAIALEGNVLAVGGARSSSAGRDIVYLYHRVGELWPSWPTDSIVGDSSIAGVQESFGHALAMSNGRLLVGASGDDELGADCGAAYVYAVGATAGTSAVLLRKLLPSDGVAQSRFGFAVALKNERALVGAPKHKINGQPVGAAYVYERDQGFPGNWGEVDSIRPFLPWTPNMDFGASLALGDGVLAVGAPVESTSPEGTDGSVHLYRRDGDAWMGLQRIAPWEDDHVSRVSRVGTSLAFLDEKLLVGAPFAIVTGLNPPANSPTGVVLVYEREPVSVPERRAGYFKVVPNPARTTAWLQMERTVELSEVRIIDNLGVCRMNLTSAMLSNERQLNLSVLPAGVYRVCLTAAGGRSPLCEPLVILGD